MNIENTDLETLIAQCAIKDQAALKRLYDLTGPYLNRVAWKILRSEESSNDVLQDAFVQIWQNANAYRSDIAKPMTWLSSIVRYRAIDKLSAEQKHSAARDLETEIDDIAAIGSQTYESVYQFQMNEHFNECLDTLNERGRQCIQLAYLQGYSREELAERFDTNINTVKSWLNRNVKRLKTCLMQKGLVTS